MRRPQVLLLALLTGVLVLALASPGAAFAQGAWWQIGSEVVPSNLQPGREGTIIVYLSDLGDEGVNDALSPLEITDTLPHGLTPVSIAGGAQAYNPARPPMSCSPVTGPVLSCTYNGALNPYERLGLTIKVKVEEPPGTIATLPNQLAVQGGGAPPATSTQNVTVDEQETRFGVQDYEVLPFDEDGSPALQAGSHPFALTTNLVFNQTDKAQKRTSVALAKDLSFTLPPGLTGDPDAVSQCSVADFAATVLETNLCPPSSVVGVTTVTAYEPVTGLITRTVPVFNLTPAQGEPARLGFEVIGKVQIVIDTAIQTGGDYAVEAKVTDAPQIAWIFSSEVTVWGVPGAQSHDSQRGWECVAGGQFAQQAGKACPESNAGLSQTPFLTMPTYCPASPQTEPLRSFTTVDSWSEPEALVSASYTWSGALGEPLAPEGCEHLPFTPAIQASAEQHAASTPTGISLDVQMPQQGTLEANALAEADVRDTTVTLPAGVQLNPSAATALQACSEEQLEGDVSRAEHEQFKARRAGLAGEGGLEPLPFPAVPAVCPQASKVGSVRIKTPLLSHELEGTLYLAEPAPNGEAGRNPFNSLIALYLIAEDPVSGVLVKLAGEGHLDESTGQVSTTFRDTPQVPFEDLYVELFGGERASLSTPSFCGAYSAQALLTPWSSLTPVSVSAAGEGFQISSGVDGDACPSGPLPLSLQTSAQSTDTAASAFTSFSLEISRADGDQELSGLTVRLPQGVSALLSSLTPCQEPPAGVEWSCGPESLIGHSAVVSGLGAYPVTLPEGDVYLTSGYDGAPFGLLVQTRAQAGPFDLGNVNVRSRINVDPHTAQVTITIDTGPRGEALPAMIRGIPAEIRKITVNVDRPDFEINPTSCEPKHIEGTLDGAEGANVPLSIPFQVGGCEHLPFAPALSATAQGHASKADGVSFVVKVTSAGLGQANIAKVSVQLPKQFSSRLTTIQKACPAVVFQANPAGCPEGSVIGHATVHTPVLKSPVIGPAYLVSYGGAAFPDIEFVLQGEGIMLVLDGKTDIKAGITYSKFESVPDQPFTSFETVLPAGPHSALTANVAEAKRYDLCGETLEMPTTIVAQNGATIEHSTKIAIDGCGAVQASQASKLTRAQLLAKALHACRTRYKHAKQRRVRCEKLARRRYGTKLRARHTRQISRRRANSRV
jgi:hypothetical protein